MAIKPVGYGGATIGPGAPVPKAVYKPPQAKPYNPWAYVPGQGKVGTGVPAAIQKAGYANPGPNPVMIPPNPTLSPPGTTPPPGVMNTPGDVPFNWGAYLAEIENDPVFKNALGAYNENSNSWRRQLESSIRSGVVGGGWDISGQVAKDPLLAAGLNNYISPEMWNEINTAAGTNQLSTKATLDRQLRANQQADLYSQAARGTAGSGAHAAADQVVGDENVLATNTAQAQLMDSLRGAQGTYLSNQAAGKQALEQTRGEVGARLAAQEGAVYDTLAVERAAAEAGKVPVPGTDEASAASTPGQIGIAWGGNPNITSVSQLTKILKGSGISYEQWRKNHLTAAKKLEGMS